MKETTRLVPIKNLARVSILCHDTKTGLPIYIIPDYLTRLEKIEGDNKESKEKTLSV